MGGSANHHFQWDEIGEKDVLAQALGPKMTYKMIEDVRLIKESVKQVYDHQKGYTDQIRQDLKFDVGDKAFVRVTPYHHMMRFM